VVPFAPGGATDVLPRMLGERLRASLGQPVIIENVSGAGGTIGLGRVARAVPDGYTLVSGNWSTFVSYGAIYTLPYDLVKDFEPVVLLPANSHLIAARKSLAAGNLLELVSWLKANQDAVSMATAGVGTGSHLAAVLPQRLTDTKFPLVHYRGGGPALQDLFSQQIDLMTNQAAVFLPHMLPAAYVRGHHQGLRRIGQGSFGSGSGNSNRRRSRAARVPRFGLERLLGAQGHPQRGDPQAQMPPSWIFWPSPSCAGAASISPTRFRCARGKPRKPWVRCKRPKSKSGGPSSGPPTSRRNDRARNRSGSVGIKLNL
jgi:hypothetical protein